MPRTLTPWAYLIPLIGLLSFVAIYYFFQIYANQTIDGLPIASDAHAAYVEARIRLQWFAATVAFTFIAFVVLASFLIDVFAHERQTDDRRIWRYDMNARMAAGLIFFAVSFVAYNVVYGDEDFLYLYLGESLFRAVFDLCMALPEAEEIAQPIARCFGPSSAADSFGGLVKFSAVTAIVAVVACMLGSVLSLARDRTASYGATETDHAKYYLYLSSALLSFGVLGLMTWMRLPLSVLPEGDAQTLYTDHIKSVALYWGVGFSVVILCYNLPTMVILHLSRERGAGDSGADGDAGTADVAPAASLREVVTAAIAFLSPTLLPLSVDLGSSLASFVGG